MANLSDPLFLSLAETSQDCIRILNLRGELEFINERGRRLLEIDEVSRNYGRYWPGLWPQVSREVAHRAVQTALCGEPSHFRAYCETAKGRAKWWDNVVSPVRDPATGAVTGLLATSHDVTSEHDAETFLDTVIENAPAVIFVKDAQDGRFLLINRAAEQIFGLPREAMLGRTDADLFPPERAAICLAQDQAVIAARDLVIGDEAFGDPEVGVRHFRTKKVATYSPQGARHIVCLAEDVTEEKVADEALKAALGRAEAANLAKSEFLANMSHEIRTPLNGVVGVADVLARTGLDAQQAEMVELIRESGQTLERLLADVLDLARIEAGHMELEAEPFDLCACIRSVAALSDLKCREKDIALAVEIAPKAASWVVGDQVRIKQVVTNLLSNAVKFTERGGVTLRLGLAADGWSFRIEVADTGVGFDPAAKEQIFGRFQQADGSITRRFGGTGLGLAITRQLVERMGGSIDCDSTPGEGSVFTVTLPLPAACPVPEAQVPEPQAPAERTARVRVLLADDHPTNRKVVELILDQADVDIVAVEDGAQALDAFRADAFDVVLMDMQMPVMDGLTATRLIREHEAAAGLPRTPIVMLTANALSEHVQASLAAGADRHLAKPVSAASLLATLCEVLAGADEPVSQAV